MQKNYKLYMHTHTRIQMNKNDDIKIKYYQRMLHIHKIQ